MAQYSTGTHFRSGSPCAWQPVRLHKRHDWLLAVALAGAGASARWISWLGLGMLMPIGILTEVLFGLAPVLVLAGGVAMVLSVAWLGMAIGRLRLAAALASR